MATRRTTSSRKRATSTQHSDTRGAAAGNRVSEAVALYSGSTRVDPRTIRATFGLTQPMFARLMGASLRAIAKWEAGQAVGTSGTKRLAELQRLHAALSSVMRPEYIPAWLQEPNPGFDGLKPIEVIERGEVDRIWRMIYYLESGMPT